MRGFSFLEELKKKKKKNNHKKKNPCPTNPRVARRILLSSLAKLVQPLTKKMEEVLKVGDQGSSKSLSRAGTMQNTFPSELMNYEFVPSSLSSITPRLLVANEVEKENPRVAYLCRFYAFKKAHDIDPKSIGRGVRKFKTAMLRHLLEDNKVTRYEKTDARLMQNFYQQYYVKYLKELDKSTGQIERSQLSRAYQMASVLFEILLELSQIEEVQPEILKAEKVVDKNREIYMPVNVLPLDLESASQSIMQLPEVIDIEEGIFDEEEEGDIEENNS